MKSVAPLRTAAPPRLRPNEPCWCGSNKKYKRCHAEEDERHHGTVGHVVRGKISPARLVPAHIVRPEYAVTGTPRRGGDIPLFTGERLTRMKHACKLAAQVLAEASALVRPGTTTDEIDAFVHERAIALGAYPSTLNYRGYPKSLCTSVNEVICHGIPDSRSLLDGDIVNLDITLFVDGMHGDCNATFPVGNIDASSTTLIDVTRQCLAAGIAAVKPGRPISDIGRAIEGLATAQGLGVVRSYCGHGIGELFHTNLQIPHYYDAHASTTMTPGLVFTIEPMICLGSPDEELWDDHWTVVTRDRSRSAQFEHTVLVTSDGAEVLTLP